VPATELMMNVAICSSGDLYGGVEKFIVTLAVQLKALPAHAVRVVLFSRGVLHEQLRERGIATELFEYPKYDVTVVPRLAQFFRDTRVDVAHTHGYKANVLCGSAAKLSGACVVKTEHGMLEPSKAFDRIKMSLNLGVDRLFSRYLVDRIVYVSKDIQKRTERHYEGVQGEVIYNGIPQSRSESFPRPPELDPSRFNIGIIGRVSAVKGHIYLLRALKDLPLSDLRLHVLGDGELRRELEKVSQESGLSERVFFLGFRPNIEDYLRALDAVVMPSLHEGFPYTMLEAAYWRVPLIASRVGGIEEALQDPEECLLVEPRNVQQLRQAIAKLYYDADLRKKIGENAHRAVMDNFLIDSMVGKYLSAYEKSLSQSIH
jgi:glycosyltransferase involved in cell wall biosynthesis